MESERSTFQFKHPFTCLLAGPTGSGKTVLLRRLLAQYKILFTRLPADAMQKKLRVLWLHGQSQPLHKVKIHRNVDVTYLEGFPDDQKLDSVLPHLIVIDDLMNELGKNQDMANLFTKGSHHWNISVVFVVQNLFHQAPVMRTLSLNSHYMLLMKNTRDRSQIRVLAAQMFPGNTSFLVKAYEDATKDPFSYIRIDHTPDTPDHLRVQAQLTKAEGYKRAFAPVVYTPIDYSHNG